MHKLSDKVTTDSFLSTLGESEELEECEDQNIYIKKKHWRFLDKLAENKKSRNQVIRDILEKEIERRGFNPAVTGEEE
jgi:hypothetical protein